MSHELQNIPALWTVLSHWISVLLLVSLLPRVESRLRVIAVSLVTLLAQALFMSYLVSVTGLVFDLLYVVFAVIWLIPFVSLSRIELPAAVYYCARSFIMGGFTASLAWQLYIWLQQQYPVFSRMEIQVSFMLGVYGAVFLLLALLERRQRHQLGEMPVTVASCAGTVLITVVIYILSSLSFASVDAPFAGSTYAEAFNIRTLVYFGGIAILYAYHLQLYESYIHTEVNVLHGMLDAQYANFQVSQESIDLINRKYHDLKHQIAILRSGAGGDSLHYLDRMEQEIQAYEAENKTGNRTLDTILTSKKLHCQELGVSLTCVADGESLGFMDELDLCSLFGNALDNAIESASQVADPEQRLIRLLVKREKGFVRLLLENRCDTLPVIRHGNPVTTKDDKRFHGFGFKSIRTTAEKYGASVNIRAQDGWFELRILFPANAAS